jgi:hydrogenase maturation protein HypF
LYNTFGSDWQYLAIPFIEKVDKYKAEKLIEAIDKKINCPLCCSAGRLFDAVAAILMLCFYSDYHAQAPMLLENYIHAGYEDFYPVAFHEQISFKPAIEAIVHDIQNKEDLRSIVTRFHNSIVQSALMQIRHASEKSSIRTVVLSGGTFQNKYLSEKLITLLKRQAFDVYFPTEVPCNDGGIALGQIAVAAHKRT